MSCSATNIERMYCIIMIDWLDERKAESRRDDCFQKGLIPQRIVMIMMIIYFININNVIHTILQDNNNNMNLLLADGKYRGNIYICFDSSFFFYFENIYLNAASLSYALYVRFCSALFHRNASGIYCHCIYHLYAFYIWSFRNENVSIYCKWLGLASEVGYVMKLPSKKLAQLVRIPKNNFRSA